MGSKRRRHSEKLQRWFSRFKLTPEGQALIDAWRAAHPAEAREQDRLKAELAEIGRKLAENDQAIAEIEHQIRREFELQAGAK